MYRGYDSVYCHLAPEVKKKCSSNNKYVMAGSIHKSLPMENLNKRLIKSKSI